MKKSVRLWGWTSCVFALFSIIPMVPGNSFFSLLPVFLAHLLLCAFLCALLVITINRLERWLKYRKGPVLSSKKASCLFWGLFCGLLLIWLLAFFCFFPGTFGADAPYQFAMYQGAAPLSTQQPLIHTFMIGSLMDLSEKLLGTPVPGISLYILVYQILFTAFAISRAARVLYWRSVPLWILIAGPLLLAVNPLVMALVSDKLTVLEATEKSRL